MSTPDATELPEPPSGNVDAALEHYKAELEAAKRPAEQQKAIEEAEIALNKSFIDGTIEVAKGSIGRAQEGAKTVQGSAAAIGTLYTGVLALAFSVTKEPLPARGLCAAVLLAGAVICATVYIAYISKAKDTVDLPDPDPSDLKKTSLGLANAFVQWNWVGAFQRRYWVRASVVMLGLALFFLPAPFITISREASGAAKTKPQWPQPIAAREPRLAAIRFKAEVAEAAAARRAGRSTGEERRRWPVARANSGPRLAAILYKAEVAEAAKAREEFVEGNSEAIPNQNLYWGLATLVAVAVALLLPLLIGRIVDKKEEEQGASAEGLKEGELMAPMAVE